MAIVKSTTAVKQTDRNAQKLMPASFGGRVRIATGTYTGTGTDAAGTVIQLVRLPAGARVLPSSKLYLEAGQGAATTLKVGDEANDARYFAAAAVGASASVKALDANAQADYVLEKEMFLTATVGAAALTAGKKITFEVFYVLD